MLHDIVMRRNFSTDHHFENRFILVQWINNNNFRYSLFKHLNFCYEILMFFFLFSLPILDFWISLAHNECIWNLWNSCFQRNYYILFTDLQISYHSNHFRAAACNAHKPIGCSFQNRNKCIWPYDWHARSFSLTFVQIHEPFYFRCEKKNTKSFFFCYWNLYKKNRFEHWTWFKSVKKSIHSILDRLHIAYAN